MRSVLLNPGPVTLSEGVRRAVTRVDLCHRESEFFDLQDAVIYGLLDVYRCDPEIWSAVLIGGSGTCAMEAMMASLLPQDANLLVLENGVYGERLSKIAEIYGIQNRALAVPWGAEIDLQAVEDSLSSGSYSHLAVVHHETTTGRLNPVEAIAGLCEQYQVEMLLDAVSSFGAESIPFKNPAVTAIAATANKCLHGIPGLAMVLCKTSALQADMPARTMSLDLRVWENHQARRSTPFTPGVNAMLGLAQALKELLAQGGWQARHTRYRQLASAVANTLHGLSVKPWLDAQESSCVLRSYHLPDDMDYNTLHGGLKQHGFIIYAGQGKLTEQLFRISTMGDISDYDLARLQQALQSVIGK
jgi:2-aminoethylphosphonate-pyruvate transaminase